MEKEYATTLVPVEEYNEFDLLKRAQVDDELALREIYDHYYGDIHRYLEVHTDSQTAEDLTQEVFARAFMNLAKFTNQGDGLKPWLITIARNTFATNYRKSNRQVPTYGGDIDVIYDLYPAADNPEKTVVDQMTINELLDNVTDDQYDTLVHTVVGGMSYEDYAATRGIKRVTVMTRIHRARARLQNARAESQKLNA
jgi:RNA polymerase sigma-70 factor (ECF subfamily)